MPAVHLHMVGNGEAAWPDLATKTLHHVTTPISVSGLECGMESGKPSVCLRLDLADGSVVLAETSLVLFLSAAEALRGRFGDPRT